jgi:shikimate dehydrogenase
LAGVIGWPVSHSRSPLLQNEWLRRTGIDGVYVPLPVAPGQLETALRGLHAAGFAGVNVTLPHKEDAYRLSDVRTPAAERCGSANTLTFLRDGRLHADSTDGRGYIESLRADGVDPAAGPVLLLGAGGAARAIAAALQEEGVAVHVASRTRARADALAAALPDRLNPIRTLDWNAREGFLPGTALLVNSSPAGMDHMPGSPCALDHAPASLVVSDIVYVPRITLLLADAQARGLRTVEGLGMLLHQGRPGFARWFGVDPVVDPALLALVRADLDGSSG